MLIRSVIRVNLWLKSGGWVVWGDFNQLRIGRGNRDRKQKEP